MEFNYLIMTTKWNVFIKCDKGL